MLIRVPLMPAYRVLGGEVGHAALLGVGAEDVVILVDEAVELVLQRLHRLALVGDLVLQVGGVNRHNLCTESESRVRHGPGQSLKINR